MILQFLTWIKTLAVQCTVLTPTKCRITARRLLKIEKNCALCEFFTPSMIFAGVLSKAWPLAFMTSQCQKLPFSVSFA